MVRWAGLICAAFAAVAEGALPFAPELRGGPSVLSGAERFRFQYHGDNDGYALSFRDDGAQHDRWFSTATKLTARWPLRAALFRAPETRALLSLSLGQVIYTPRSIFISDPRELQGDRPFGGWLAFSGSIDVISRGGPFGTGGGGYTQLSAELYGGAVGPWSLAGWTQRTSHTVSAWMATDPSQFPMPEGWGRAESEPGVALDASLSGETTLLAARDARPLGWTGSHTGALWLVGGRVDAGSTLVAASAFTTAIVGLLGDPVAPASVTWPAAIYLYARAEGRVVAWNGSIQRPLLDGSSGAQHRWWVGELSAGVVARLGPAELTYSQLYRTNEVASLPAALRTGQLIGQVTLSVIY